MQINIDVDGVVANFDEYSSELFGQPVSITNQTNMIDDFWLTIYNHEDFYNKLPLMPDAMDLFNSVKHLNPRFLTGLPKFHEGGWADKQKRVWIERNFPGTPVVTCLSEEKSLHMEPGDILIDDWLKYRHLWENKGGIFIHHTSAANSILELKKLGVL